ncbi:MAG: hypothetical protein U1E41_11960 [Paracoccus sp. (in: a-proteobacteria)]
MTGVEQIDRRQKKGAHGRSNSAIRIGEPISRRTESRSRMPPRKITSGAGGIAVLKRGGENPPLHPFLKTGGDLRYDAVAGQIQQPHHGKQKTPPAGIALSASRLLAGKDAVIDPHHEQRAGQHQQVHRKGKYPHADVKPSAALRAERSSRPPSCRIGGKAMPVPS